VDLTSIVLAPVRVPVRIARALDDLATLADRARREPDPVEEVRGRIDLLLAEIDRLNRTAEQLVVGGADLTDTAKALHATVLILNDVATRLHRTGWAIEGTGREIVSGGQELNLTGRALDGSTRELIDGGDRLRQVTEQLESDARVFRAALPRLLDGLETVEELESAVETVAETIEPLQGTAERVGRVTKRLSRRPE
jgi:hypothetical protein